MAVVVQSKLCSRPFSLRVHALHVRAPGDSWFQGQTMKLPKGAGYEFQMQYGSIGWSVGAVLGYAVAAKPKGRRVVAMIGDGSFQMTAQVCAITNRVNSACVTWTLMPA